MIKTKAARVAIIIGRGRLFLSGADIDESGKPPLPQSLPDVINRIEACNEPVVSNVTITGQYILNPGMVVHTALTENGYTRAAAIGERYGAMSIPRNGIA